LLKRRHHTTPRHKTLVSHLCRHVHAAIIIRYTIGIIDIAMLPKNSAGWFDTQVVAAATATGMLRAAMPGWRYAIMKRITAVWMSRAPPC
jgi:hypothetical protein